MSTKIFPSDNRVDKEGLPIPKKSSVAVDDEGLPVPAKKKDVGGNLQTSPSDISAPKKTEAQPTSSESKSLPEVNLHNLIFNPSVKQADEASDVAAGAAERKLEKSFTTKDLYTRDLGKEKAKVEQQKIDFRTNYLNDSLTAENIEWLKQNSKTVDDYGGLTAAQIAGAINIKNKKLKDGADASLKENIANHAKKIKDIDDQIAELVGSNQFAPKYSPAELDKRVGELNEQKQFLKSSLTRAYVQEKQAVVDNYKKEILSHYPNSNWGDLHDDAESKIPDARDEFQKEMDAKNLGSGIKPLNGLIEVDKKTHQLTERSVKKINDFVDAKTTKASDDIINAQTTGDTKVKKGNYPDIARDLVSSINTEINNQYYGKEHDKEFVKNNPQAKPLIDFYENQGKYFSAPNVESATAAAETIRNKNFIESQQKYFGKGGIMLGNAKYVSIQEGYAEKVAKKLMPEDIAKKQMQQDIENDKELKPLWDNFEKEISNVNNNARKNYETFIINGAKQKNDNLVVYDDGTVGVKGMTKQQSAELRDKYEKEKGDYFDKLDIQQGKAIKLKSDERAKSSGAFLGSFGQSTNDFMSAANKWVFDRTGWGGDNVRWFQAKQNVGDRIDLGDVAKTWQWHGATSLLNPNFYLSGVGNMLPIVAPTALVALATEGAGVPEYIAWGANAGVFTFQNALPTYNDLAGSRDQNGNLISEYDAANIMTSQVAKDFLPNMAWGAFSAGALSRAKNVLARPTIGKLVGATAKESVVGAVPMVWQGYNSYSAMLEAQGKTPSFYDYMQSPEFAANIFNGISGGFILGLSHIPARYNQEFNKWINTIHSTEGELRNNALYHYSLQNEIDGNGNMHRDQLKMLLLNNKDITPNEKQDIERQLLYSTQLDRNIKAGNLDKNNPNELYQAHNLSMADMYDNLAEKNADNKNLSKIYSDKAKEFRDESKGENKFYTLFDKTSKPIFLNAKEFDKIKDNKLLDLINDGVITKVMSSDEENFATKYTDQLNSKGEEVKLAPYVKPELNQQQLGEVIDILDKNKADFNNHGAMMIEPELGNKDNHQEIADYVLMQAIDNPEQIKKIVGEKAFDELQPYIADLKSKQENISSQKSAVNEETQTILDKGIKGQEKVNAEKENDVKEKVTSTPEGAGEKSVPSFDEFKTRVLSDYLNVKDSKFDWNYSSDLSAKDREKAVDDIRNGIDSPQAKKLQSELKTMHDNGNVYINRGRGNQSERIEVPIKDWFALDHNEQDAAINMDDATAAIINDNDITEKNINSLKHLFNGFPYNEDDFNAVKDSLSGKSKSDEQIKTGGEPSEKEKELVEKKEPYQKQVEKANKAIEKATAENKSDVIKLQQLKRARAENNLRMIDKFGEDANDIVAKLKNDGRLELKNC